MLLMPYSKAIKPMDKDLINFWQALQSISRNIRGEKVNVTIFKCKIRVYCTYKRNLSAFVLIFVGHVFIKLRRFTIREHIFFKKKIKKGL
jgi:hypothetical protein